VDYARQRLDGRPCREMERDAQWSLWRQVAIDVQQHAASTKISAGSPVTCVPAHDLHRRGKSDSWKPAQQLELPGRYCSSSHRFIPLSSREHLSRLDLDKRVRGRHAGTLSRSPSPIGQKTGVTIIGIFAQWLGGAGFHIADLLGRMGATVTCLALSDQHEMDGVKPRLAEALRAWDVFSSALPTALRCRLLVSSPARGTPGSSTSRV
jgi:hypothetical protein